VCTAIVYVDQRKLGLPKGFTNYDASKSIAPQPPQTFFMAQLVHIDVVNAASSG
jgi:hypothetical protein